MIELDLFRTLLEGIRSDLKNRSRDTDVLTIEATTEELDRIQQASDHDFAVGSLHRSRSQLKDVQEALRRIRDGVFGIYVNCEEDIGSKRLTALPWAARCIACQQAADLDVAATSRDGVDGPFYQAA